LDDKPTEQWDDSLRETPDDRLFDRLSPRSSRGPWILVGVALIVAVAAVAYIFFWPRAGDQTTAAPAAEPARAAEPVKPLGGVADAVTLPPLDESDAVVADLVRKLSTHPRVIAWLATRGLVRNFAAVIVNIAEGNAPTMFLRPLRPASGFLVLNRTGDVIIDPKSYERYKSLTDAVASIDAKGSADLYATVKPRLEEAHRDLGELDTSFDRSLERAIVLLLKTPIPDGPIRLQVGSGIGYEFADPKLEALAPAQKQLLRMGPDNARVIQAKLLEIAIALGIPADRL
jgi:hypothetical protein